MYERPFFITGIVGLLVIIAAIWTQQVFPKEAANMAKGFSTPIIFFEFIQSPAEVNNFFGITTYGKADEKFVNQMDRGNYVDIAFMLSYSAFLFLFFRKLTTFTGIKLFKTGMLLALVAFVADLSENIQLLSITAELESGNYLTQLFLLNLFTWIKWGSLAISLVLFSYWLFNLTGIYRFVGYVTTVPIILGIIAFIKRGLATELFAKSVGIAFFIMICYCFLYRFDKNTWVKS